MSGWLTALGSFLIHDMIVLALAPVVLLRRKEPSATIAWLLAIILMPLFGALAFLMFGNTRLQRTASKLRMRKQKFRRQVQEIISRLESPVDIKGQLQLFKLLAKINPMRATGGNDVEVFTDMNRNFAQQLQAIANAKHHVHVEYYIFEPDSIGLQFRDAMIAAAKRGVHVRFLYDAIGSMKLGRSFLSEMERAGVETAGFIPFRLFTHRWIFNFRNHRKIVVVDGEVGFTGGANIGEEYLGQSNVGHWRDTHLRICGPAVLELQRVFAEDWAFAAGEDLYQAEYFPDTRKVGNVIAQVVPGGPDMEVAIYHELYFSAVVNAVERIRITTPYFVPSDAILVALQTSARRGVKVELLVPGKSTHSFVQWAGQSYYQDLLEAGVEIYEFPHGFLHSKIVTVDSRWSVVGTANMDNRSMKLNFEIGVVFYDLDVTLQLDSIFEDTMRSSDKIDLSSWSNRSLYRHALQNSARLFSPIL